MVLVVQAACTASFALIPVLAFTWRSWWRPLAPTARRRGLLIGAMLALIPKAVLGVGAFWVLGGYFDPRGVNGRIDNLGLRPTLLPGPVWGLISLASVGAMVLLCGLIAEWLATPRRHDLLGTMLVAHVAVTGCALAAAAAANGQLFDRYLWALVLSAAILIVRRGSVQSPVPARFFLAALGALSLALTLNSNAFDAARWQAASRLVAAGVPAASIDAGLEWVGAHAVAPVDLRDPYTGGGASSFWEKWFPHGPICYVVASSTLHDNGFTLVGTHSYGLLGVGPTRRLYVYRSGDTRCSATTPGPH
jgi:hypothetical protein